MPESLPHPAGECVLCAGDGGVVLHREARLRVVLAAEPTYPGFLRVIWRDHVREMTDLAAADATHLFTVVLACERVLREVLSPLKINLASLGNVVPHVHWHVIPRFADDPTFPDPVWSAPRRAAMREASDELGARVAAALRAQVERCAGPGGQEARQ